MSERIKRMFKRKNRYKVIISGDVMHYERSLPLEREFWQYLLNENEAYGVYTKAVDGYQRQHDNIEIHRTIMAYSEKEAEIIARKDFRRSVGVARNEKTVVKLVEDKKKTKAIPAEIA